MFGSVGQAWYWKDPIKAAEVLRKVIGEASADQVGAATLAWIVFGDVIAEMRPEGASDVAQNAFMIGYILRSDIARFADTKPKQRGGKKGAKNAG